MRTLGSTLLLLVLGCAGAGAGANKHQSATLAAGPGVGEAPSRSFHIRYVATLSGLPAGRDLRLWIPLPDDDPHQRIQDVEVSSPLPHRITQEPVHGDLMVYLAGKVPASQLEVTVTYVVDRYPYVNRPQELDEGSNGANGQDLYLRPSQLMIVNDRIRTLAKEVAGDRVKTMAKARAFYDHIGSEMQYGKPADLPWGRGDTIYACDSRIGNCTDFHSYFISLCLAEQVPARFQIGLYGDYEQKSGEEYETGGYHCWAEFYVKGKGWVPVDISEGDKNPERWEFFFGGHTDNRVTLSTGRDLVLSPPQRGEPLNYFIFPYAEVDGVEFKGVSKKSYWRDR